ncbi:MAG: TonB C-terminal domain-containing protein [Acidobacteria bacterium]|nr:TonB C-terminal domain-containing protein [Acidobacteriota bacterium]
MSHPDVFEQSQPLQRPLLASVALHASITAVILGWSWWSARVRMTFGDPNSNSGPGFVTTVDAIPMPTRSGIPNPVADNSESLAPSITRPKAQPEEDDPTAIDLGGRKKPLKKTSKKKEVSVPYRPKKDYDPNQLYSSRGTRMSSPMYAVKGGGGVGFGTGTPFGSRLGWYADLIRERIGEKWRTQDLDARLNTAPVVTVMFDIQRNGQVTGARVIQSSGNYALDRSAVRAIQEASPLPALPPEFERKSANVEFSFQLKR